jgi:two-component sensor histidine kinase
MEMDGAGAASAFRRGHPTVRSRLLLMAISLVVPAAVFMFLLLHAEYRQSRERYEDQLIATTRALALATDRQLGEGHAILRGLAASAALAAGDLAAFEDQARRTVAGGSGWVVLSDRGNRQLVNTRAAPGAPLPTHVVIPAATWRALEGGHPVVSNLVFGTLVQRPVVAIDKPVRVRGQTYALSYLQEPAALASIFRNQRVPETWVASILDRNGVVVARSRDQARLVGQMASEDLRHAMASEAEGVIFTHTLDGTATLSAWSRSPSYGWTFVVGVPQAELQAASRGSIGLLGVVSVLLLGAGALLAVLFSKRISREVRSLMEDAQVIADGALVEPRPRDLAETAEVRRSLRGLSLLLRDRAADRELAANRQKLMINELNHRVKNTLATVQSLAMQSLGRGEAKVDAFNERLAALARAHDLLTRHVWEKAELHEVIQRTTEPYRNRTTICGPTVWLAPNAAVSLSMVFHELATNAVKYGALSAETGRVEVDWRIDREKRELILTWTESGGPRVVAPERRGFGSRLIGRSLASELGGSAELAFRHEGLVCVITATLGERVWSAEPPAESRKAAE